IHPMIPSFKRRFPRGQPKVTFGPFLAMTLKAIVLQNRFYLRGKINLLGGWGRQFAHVHFLGKGASESTQDRNGNKGLRRKVAKITGELLTHHASILVPQAHIYI